MRIKIPSISFEVTADCNLNCMYCYNHWKRTDNKISECKNYELAKKTLKKLFKVADVKHVTFTGGEPLIAERFSELVLYVRMKGATVTVISNGTYPNFSHYRQLVDLGVSLFELPIHSYKSASHDYLTQHIGSWDKSIKNINQLLTINAEVVAVIVLTKINCADIGNTLKCIHSIGIKRVMINRVNIGGMVTENFKALLMSSSEFKNAFKEAMIISNDLKMSVTSNVCIPICILNPKDYKGIRFTSCSFDMTKRPITVEYKGNVRFCNHSPVVIGNIFSDKIEDIFSSKEVKQWKNIVPEFCKDCKAYDFCKAGCRAASEQMGLSLNNPDPIINHMEIDQDLLSELKPTPNTKGGINSVG